jgi:hypothetical protein
MYQLQWNHASSVKTKCPTQKLILVQKNYVLNYTITMKLATTKVKQGSVLVLNDSENV